MTIFLKNLNSIIRIFTNNIFNIYFASWHHVWWHVLQHAPERRVYVVKKCHCLWRRENGWAVVQCTVVGQKLSFPPFSRPFWGPTLCPQYCLACSSFHSQQIIIKSFFFFVSLLPQLCFTSFLILTSSCYSFGNKFLGTCISFGHVCSIIKHWFNILCIKY